MAAMVLLASVVRKSQKLSEVVMRYQKYITLEETNFHVQDPKLAMQKLREIYAHDNPFFLDGITVEYPDGSWWNFRPSSNEPLLRFNMEAITQERFDELYSEIIAHIRTFGTSSSD